MNSDAAFITGRTHRVCQDYARANKEGGFVIISDGCSGSPDTDFGARLLLKSAENAILHPKYLSENIRDTIIHATIPLLTALQSIEDAQRVSKSLNLDEQSLDATLIIARYEIEKVHVSMFGDGVVAARRKNTKTLDVFTVQFESGFPDYLSYKLSAERQKLLKEYHPNNNPQVDSWEIPGEGAPIISLIDTNEYRSWAFSQETHDLVAIFSDGIFSFQDDCGLSYPWQTVVQDLMDIKATKGEFVQRSMNWMKKAYNKRGVSWEDDVSMGAIYLGD